jgi:hypothetical protein
MACQPGGHHPSGFVIFVCDLLGVVNDHRLFAPATGAGAGLVTLLAALQLVAGVQRSSSFSRCTTARAQANQAFAAVAVGRPLVR